MGFGVVRSPGGLGVVPASDGQPLTHEQFDALPGAERQRLQEHAAALEDRVEATLRQLRQNEREAQQAHTKLVADTAAAGTRQLLRDVKDTFEGLAAVQAIARGRRLLEQQKANPFRVRAFRRAADTLARLPRTSARWSRPAGRKRSAGCPVWALGSRPPSTRSSPPGAGACSSGSAERSTPSSSSVRSRAWAPWPACSDATASPRRPRSRRWPGSSMSTPSTERRPTPVASRGSRPTASTLPGRRWLPVLHTERDSWHFTALFSNTARAHELGRTRDWVVLYFRADHEVEGQRTVVTETQGPQAGQRVVRGRESACQAHDGATSDRV
jgi:hypothetical protein